MTLTAPYQAEYNGLVLGDGTAYDIVAIRGVDDLPDMRVSDTPRPSDHGLFAGRDLAGARTVEIELEIWAATDAAYRDAVDALAAATVIGAADAPLSFRLPELDDRRINCRPRNRRLPVDKAYLFHAGTAVVQFVATDPRVYADTETVSSVGPATSGGGRTYDRTYPLTYAAGGTGGNISAPNSGNFPTRPVLTISGPSTTPKVEHIESGRYLQLDLVVAAGEVVVLDTDARTVLLNGTASRYSSLTPGSSWFELAPGANTLKFTSADSLGTLEVRYRSAWI